MTDKEYNEQMAARDMRTAIQLLAALAIVIVGGLLIGWLA